MATSPEASASRSSGPSGSSETGSAHAAAHRRRSASAGWPCDSRSRAARSSSIGDTGLAHGSECGAGRYRCQTETEGGGARLASNGRLGAPVVRPPVRGLRAPPGARRAQGRERALHHPSAGRAGAHGLPGTRLPGVRRAAVPIAVWPREATPRAREDEVREVRLALGWARRGRRVRSVSRARRLRRAPGTGPSPPLLRLDVGVSSERALHRRQGCVQQCGRSRKIPLGRLEGGPEQRCLLAEVAGAKRRKGLHGEADEQEGGQRGGQ